jgi:hypothetical protein
LLTWATCQQFNSVSNLSLRILIESGSDSFDSALVRPLRTPATRVPFNRHPAANGLELIQALLKVAPHAIGAMHCSKLFTLFRIRLLRFVPKLLRFVPKMRFVPNASLAEINRSTWLSV